MWQTEVQGGFNPDAPEADAFALKPYKVQHLVVRCKETRSYGDSMISGLWASRRRDKTQRTARGEEITREPAKHKSMSSSVTHEGSSKHGSCLRSEYHRGPFCSMCFGTCPALAAKMCCYRNLKIINNIPYSDYTSTT